MSLIDIVIIALILLFGLWGLFRGLIVEVFEVLGLVAGIWGGRTWGGHLAHLLPQVLPSRLTALLAALVLGIAIFIG
ncbi:MAG: CvpA family protein, partial [bacterium]